MKRFLTLLFLIIIPAILILGNIETHANSDGTTRACSCHGADAGEEILITVNGFPENLIYQPSETYQVTVQVNASSGTPNTNKGGTWISVDQGTLSTVDPNLRLEDSTQLVHSSDSAARWNFNWTAPSGSGSVTFTILAMVVDDDGTAGNDLYSSKEIVLLTEGSSPPKPSNYEDDIILYAVLGTLLLVGLIALMIFADRVQRRKRTRKGGD